MIGLGVLTTLQSQLPPRVRGVGVGLTTVSSTRWSMRSIGPLLVALLTDRVFADRSARVGQSLAWVIVPALLCAALLFALAARSLERESGAELAAASGQRQRDDDP
ncbi:MAG: hypothetical protein R3E65_08295 [Steroidobacteraceae bacterium]